MEEDAGVVTIHQSSLMRPRCGGGLVAGAADDSRIVCPMTVTHDHASSLATIPPIPVKRLDRGIDLPHRAHPTDAGIDIRSTESVTIAPGERVLVGTGIAVAIPAGYVGLIHPRSGLALKHGLSIVNTPGTIDADYRGEIKVCLVNLDSRTPIEIQRNDRIAQLVIQKVELCDLVEVDDLDETVRGASGYGSTGAH